MMSVYLQGFSGVLKKNGDLGHIIWQHWLRDGYPVTFKDNPIVDIEPTIGHMDKHALLQSPV